MDTFGLILFIAGIVFLGRNILVSARWIARRGKVLTPFTPKTSVIRQFSALGTGLVFLSSFSRCKLNYLWLLLGVLFVFSSVIGLISVPFVYKTAIPKAYNQSSKGMRGFFVGQSAFGLIGSVTLLCLWIYSWRNLFN